MKNTDGKSEFGGFDPFLVCVYPVHPRFDFNDSLLKPVQQIGLLRGELFGC